VESVSDSIISLSNAPLLCGLVSVNGLGGEIATTEEWAEKRKHTEKAVCARQSPKDTIGSVRTDKLGTPRD